MSSKKENIFKIRINNLIEEHADALAQAQQLHEELQQAKLKISDLEDKLRNKNVQKEPEVTIIEHTVDSDKD